MCLYYGALCFGVDIAQLIVEAIGSAAAIWAAVVVTRQSKGPDKGDKEVEVEDESDGQNGDCGEAYAEEVILAPCGVPDPLKEWIEVPTGGSFALESEYYYLKTNNNNNLITSHSTTSPNQLYLAKVISGGEDLRTWYLTSGGAAPAAHPLP